MTNNDLCDDYNKLENFKLDNDITFKRCKTLVKYFPLLVAQNIKVLIHEQQYKCVVCRFQTTKDISIEIETDWGVKPMCKKCYASILYEEKYEI